MAMLDEDINGKCDKRTLAAHGPFGVHLCKCGAVHLTSGFVTLRLELAAFLELAVVVNQGHSALTTQNIPMLQ
jgi:hypothetical protein